MEKRKYGVLAYRWVESETKRTRGRLQHGMGHYRGDVTERVHQETHSLQNRQFLIMIVFQEEQKTGQDSRKKPDLAIKIRVPSTGMAGFLG